MVFWSCLLGCARARTRGSAPAPPWPAALPHPLQGVPAPPFPPPCLARQATRTAPTGLSPVPPRPWRAETAGSLVRNSIQVDDIQHLFRFVSFKWSNVGFLYIYVLELLIELHFVWWKHVYRTRKACLLKACFSPKRWLRSSFLVSHC